jgi:hypothetical protein
MRNSRRFWRVMLIALAGAGALSGCYYDPYTGYSYPYPPYPYPWGYPYGYGYSYPPPPGPGANPAARGAAPYSGAPSANPPIQSAPLPPPPAQ